MGEGWADRTHSGCFRFHEASGRAAPEDSPPLISNSKGQRTSSVSCNLGRLIFSTVSQMRTLTFISENARSFLRLHDLGEGEQVDVQLVCSGRARCTWGRVAGGWRRAAGQRVAGLPVMLE